MPLVLLGQIGSVFKIARLSAHTDGSVQIERQFFLFVITIQSTRTFRLCLDETIQAGDVFELCIRVQQKRGVIRVC